MEMLGMILLVLFGGITLIALLVTVSLLLPASVESARKKIESNLLRSFLIGLVNLIFYLALLTLLGYIISLFGQPYGNTTMIDTSQIIGPGIFIVLGILISLTVILFALRGLSALTSLLGERIGKAKNPFVSDLHGGLLLVLACLTPYIGWYIFTPFVLCLGLGASVLAISQRKTALPKKA